MGKKKNKLKSSYSMTKSLIALAGLIILVFAFIAVFVKNKSAETIESVGQIYMTGMSEEISLHYETIVDLRISMVQAIVDTHSSEDISYESFLEDLTYNAKAREFEYLAFYSYDGEFEMIYGEEIRLTDPQPFLNSLRNHEKKIAVGTDKSGNRIVLLGVPCDYEMASREKAIALIAAMPIEYMQKALFLDTENPLVLPYIIRKDGSYVIRSNTFFNESSFDQIYEVFDESDEQRMNQYIQEFINAMEENKDYSIILEGKSARRHMYCTKLPYSEWYLILILPFDTLDEVVLTMGVQWVYLVYAMIAVVLFALVLLFVQYYKMTHQQMHKLEQLNEEAVQARKEAEHANKAKSEFLSNMSHDIRTPMNAIVGMTAIASTELDNKEHVQNCLRKISLSSKHLLGLINDILDMSKIESGKMVLNTDQISLRETMESIVNIIQPQVKEKNQQFDISIKDIYTENVCCDGLRLNQVLINLLGNAVKFTPEKGKIHVSVYEENSLKGEDYVQVHLIVKDNGIGMSQEYQKKIFDSFSREDTARVQKTEGTGLGMAITKYILDAMNGTISVKSKLGEGSEFHVTLDLKKADMKEEEMILPNWNMLIIDDDLQLCESAGISLKSIGIQPEWRTSAESALSLIAERHKSNHDFDVILLDWKLSDMNGIEVAREIRKLYGENIPILLISAYDWSEIEEEAKSVGINNFISKPLFKSTLYHGLKTYVKVDDSATEEGQKDFGGKYVLIAEDNDLNWEIAEDLLSELGLCLERAENGKQAVEMFEASSIGYYDAILMDLRMPIMNGYEATEVIRKLNREDANLPIFAMTADAFYEDIRKCLDVGMNAHIAKPIDIQEISKLLDKYLN